MKMSQFIVEYLKKMGVRAIFGVGGANIEDLYEALFRVGSGMEVVLAKHEFSAGTMADAYAKMTGLIGTVISTSGGGAFNLLPSLAESFSSQVPVLAIIGQVPMRTEGKGGFQDSSGLSGSINAETIFQGVSKYCRRITDPQMIQQAMLEATTCALQNPQGPAVLLIPKDIQQSDLENVTFSLPSPSSFHEVQPNPSEIDKAILLLQSSKTGITFICGKEVYRARVESHISRLVDLLKASVAVTAEGKASFDNDSPYFIGVVGAMGNSSAQRHIQESDTLVIVGTALPDLDRMGLESALSSSRVIYIHSDKPFFQMSQEHVALQTSISLTLNLLLSKLEVGSRSFNFVRKINTGLESGVIECRGEVSLSSMSDPIRLCSSELEKDQTISKFSMSEEFLKTFQRVLEPHSNILVDAGNIGASAVHFLRIPKSCTFNIALGMGGMGYTYGAAIGATLANRRKTYAISGDGSFFMHGSEVHTAIELDLPITYLVFNNNAHGMCVTRESVYFKAEYSFNRFKKSHLAEGMAGMFPSLASFSVSCPEELENCLIRTQGLRSPVFISLELSAEEVPPFQPFLKKRELAFKVSNDQSEVQSVVLECADEVFTSSLCLER